MGQRSLVDYGIQTDESDYRAHVGFAGGIVYFFETQKGQEVLEGGNYIYKRGRIPNAPQDTFGGYPVPWKDVGGCQEIDIPADILDKYKPKKTDTTYKKGDAAIATIKAMLLRGLIPVNLMGVEVEEKDLQIRGEDIIVSANFSIQVKCDWMAGRGGWGNLFFQTEEIHLKGIQHEQIALPLKIQD